MKILAEVLYRHLDEMRADVATYFSGNNIQNAHRFDNSIIDMLMKFLFGHVSSTPLQIEA